MPIYDTLDEKVSAAANQILKDCELFSIRSGGAELYIRKSKILYLESRKKNIALVYKDFECYKEIVYVGALREELRKLPPPDFFSPHASFIVNFDQCTYVSDKEIKLVNGKIIPVTRSKRGECIGIFNRHLAKTE